MLRSRNKSWRAGVTAAGCLALSVVAILLWGRLKLVTGVPRTAYADPKEVAPPPKPQPKPAPIPENRPDLRGD